MKPIKVNIKKLNNEAVIPQYAHDTDAGLDLVATSETFDKSTGCLIYGTGLAIEIPEGYVGLLFPRSSVYKTSMYMTNCVGVIDSGYRGEVKAVFTTKYIELDCKSTLFRIVKLFSIRLYNKWVINKGRNLNANYHNGVRYKVGDRIAQLIIMPYPKVNLVEVDDLTDTDRGTGGYGSTGR